MNDVTWSWLVVSVLERIIIIMKTKDFLVFWGAKQIGFV